MAEAKPGSLGTVISMIAAVLVGSLMTAQYYRDEVGPIESLKYRLSLILFLLSFVIIIDIVLVGVILYG